MLSFKTLAVLAAVALGAVARPADMAARDEAPATTPSTEKITFAMAAPGLEAGVQCGPNKCGAGLVCCNESCGICSAPRGVCITLWCGEPILSV
ncbi:hypothetical protein ACHAQF_001884 [Verticillium nonalfalfae]